MNIYLEFVWESKREEYVALSIPMQHTADRGVWFIAALSSLHHFNKWPGGLGNILPAAKVLIRMRTFKCSVSATPFTLPTSLCLLFSLSLSYCLPQACVCLCVLNKIDSLGTLKDGYIRGPAGLTPSSATLTFCLSPLKRPSHSLHQLIGHCHREKKAKELP